MFINTDERRSNKDCIYINTKYIRKLYVTMIDNKNWKVSAEMENELLSLFTCFKESDANMYLYNLIEKINGNDDD